MPAFAAQLIPLSPPQVHPPCSLPRAAARSRLARQMTTLTRLLAVIVFLLSAAAAAVDALVFDMPSGTSKCFAELLHGGADIHASYRVAKSTSPVASTVSVRVMGPDGEELHLTEGVKTGRFVFHAAGYGEYMACFWTPHYERGAIVSVDLQWAIGLLAHAEGPLIAVDTTKRGCTDHWWPITKAEDKSVLEVILTLLRKLLVDS